MGANRSECIGEGLVRKYSDIEYALKAYEKVCEYWNDTLERVKIKSDAFLYNYFYNNKINRLLDGSKIIIYIVVIGLVIVNLGFFIRYLSAKEMKKRG